MKWISFLVTVSVSVAGSIPLLGIEEYSAENSIALAALTSENGLSKSVSHIDCSLRSQSNMIPLLGISEKTDIRITNQREISQFFSALWSPSDIKSIWKGPNCSIAVRIGFHNHTPAYFHIYLIQEKVPQVTPWTGYDAATYKNASLLQFLKKVGFDAEKLVENILPNQ